MTSVPFDKLLEKRRFRLGSNNGPMTLAQGVSAAAAPEGGYDGPDADKLEVWWSATQPLETLDNNAYAMQIDIAGATRFVSLDGRQAYVKDAAAASYIDAIPGPFSVSPSAGDTWTIYAMVHAPTTMTGSRFPVILDGSGQLSWISMSPTTVEARSDFGSSATDSEPYAKDVAVVLHSETIFDPSAGYSVEVGTDDTQGGTPATTASGSPTVALDNLRIAST